MMLPLSNSKRAIESSVINFCELVRLYDPDQYLNREVMNNLVSLDSPLQTKNKNRITFLSIYL